MYVGNRVPFTDIETPGANNTVLKGKFLIDFGTDTTVIDLRGFPRDTVTLSSNNQYSLTMVNGPFKCLLFPQYFNVQPCGNIAANGIREAGIIEQMRYHNLSSH